MHGRTLYEEVVRVPLVVLLPWRREGRVIDEIVSLVDLGPTLLDLAGIPVPQSFQGRSFFESSRRAGDAPPAAFGELMRMRTRVTTGAFIREGPWKLVVAPKGPELYHLPSDPGEARNVSAEHAVEAGYLRERLMARIQGLRPDAPAPLPLDSGLSPAEREALEKNLKALGYVE
jgi:arylsulfatase A-like enzyme